MSPGGYESSSIPSSSSQYESWRNGAPPTYDRSYNPPLRHNSPSPQQSRRYDSYVPPRSGNAFRENNYPNVYRPNEYRQTSDSYYPRSPSPGRYNSVRGSEADAWDRHTSWQSTSKPSPTWQDTRKPLPPSPTSPVSRDRNRRDNMMATRMFEPSDPWKAPHPDRPHRVDTYPDYRPRDASEVANPRNPYPGGDRYRPQPHRDAHTYESRSNYDSYRPRNEAAWTPRERRDSASSIDGNRRESISGSHTRSSSRYEGRRASSPKPVTPISPTNTHSPHRSSRGYPARSPSRGRRPTTYDDHLPYDSDASSRKATYSRKPKSRSASRSSIASSHVSEEPPPAPSVQPTPASPQAALSKELVDVAFPVDKTSLTSSDVTNALSTNRTCGSDTLELAACNVSQDVVEQKQHFDNLAPTHVPPSPHDQVVAMRALEASAPSPPPVRPAALQTQNRGPHASDDMTIDDVPFRLEPSLPIVGDKVYYSMAVDAPKSEPRTTPPQPEPELELEQKPEPTLIPAPLDTPSNQPQDAPDITQGAGEEPCHVVEIPEEVPSLSEARSRAEALRIVVMTRLLCDRQTRAGRVNPVLDANRATAPHSQPLAFTAEDLVKEITEGPKGDARTATNAELRPSFAQRFEQRQAVITAKAQRLREQYLALHEKWLAHCAILDEQSRPLTTEPVETTQSTVRATRRTAAALGDAVRSDLEMEQIIASLGNDEATDPNQLSLKNLAKVPEMISVTNGWVDYVYNDTNHLIEDPVDFYGTHTGIHDWTEEEKETFLDKFAAYPKQFGTIASFLPNKTAAQCVDYYYLHKKTLIDFRKVVQQYAPSKRKRRKLDKKKGNGLIADIHQHDDEVHRDDPTTNGRPTRTRRSVIAPEPKKPASRRNTVAQSEITPTSTPTPEPDARSRRKRGGTTITASGRATPANQPSQPATDDAEEDADQDPRPAKRVRRPVARKPKSSNVRQQETFQQQQPQETISAGPELTSRAADQSDTPRRKTTPAILWSDEDKSLFLTLLAQHGDDFKRIAASMPNKTTIQVSNYYRSNMAELGLDRVVATAPKRSPTPEVVVREGWKEPPYPGFGVISPIESSPSGSTSTSVLVQNANQSPKTTTLPRLPELSRPLDLDPTIVSVWPPLNPDLAASTSSLNASPASSPNLTRSYSYRERPVSNGRPAASDPFYGQHQRGPLHRPSFSPEARPVHRGPFPPDARHFPAYLGGRQGQPHRSPHLPPLKIGVFVDQSQHPPAVYSLTSRAENPYPVLPPGPSSGAAISSPQHFMS